MQQLMVSEIFRSLQGESTRAGLPCVFVRLSGCNLHCRWCDTGYAREAGTAMSTSEILETVAALGTGLVEVTGGEPLLQPGAAVLADRLCARCRAVLVETNGSILIPERREWTVIMDIKTPSSGEADSFHAGNAARLRAGDEVKFVIADRTDFDWALARIAEHGLRNRGVSLLMSPVAEQCRPADLAAWILAAGQPDLRMQLQLHKLIWPEAERGV